MKLFEAVIFDLDGVLVHTDRFHYLAWKRLCEEEGIPFDEKINDRLRGVSRTESLDIILQSSGCSYGHDAKSELAERKNIYYKNLLRNLTPDDVSPAARAALDQLQSCGIKLAIGSSSKNAPFILERLGIGGMFQAVADGNAIQRSKPDPEVFLLAAGLLEVGPERCLVVEDADAGVIAAKAGGMKVAAIGDAAFKTAPDYRIKELGELLGIIE